MKTFAEIIPALLDGKEITDGLRIVFIDNEDEVVAYREDSVYERFFLTKIDLVSTGWRVKE